MTLDTFDLHQPLPEHLKGKYDLVHVRLFLTVVKKDDPSPLLERLMAMLSTLSSSHEQSPVRKNDWPD